MNADPRTVFLEELARIAPEADVAALAPDADLRDALDIDSMDVLNLVAALHARLGVDVPEADAGRLMTVDGAAAYLAARLREVRR
jgi:acyl carrier protein